MFNSLVTFQHPVISIAFITLIGVGYVLAAVAGVKAFRTRKTR